jgi:PAS domain S-box-containing protein
VTEPVHADRPVSDEVLGPEAYRALFEHSPDGVLFTVPDGRVLAANPAACRILARTEAEICALGRQRLVDPTDPRWRAMLVARDRTGEGRGVARMIRGDGVPIEVEVSSEVFLDARGEQRSCTIIRDVTDRVTTERELHDSRQRLAEAERVAQMGSWEWNIASDQITWSEGLFRIFGLAPDDFDPTFAGGQQQRVDPADRPHVRQVIDQALAQRSAFVLEYRALRADGRVRTLRSRGEVVVDDAGEPIRLVGIAQDITDAKLAQEALESTSADLQRRAAELQELARPSTPTPRPHAPLTPRQLEILQLVAEGLTSAQIADRLFITAPTVKWHVKQILTKTAYSNRAEAVARVLGATRPYAG